ncbi:peptidase M28 [Candidatus Moduliflexus flocculans]|uniref:Peptidase M28 n=1 Tax=Candidatus Moduliflexus flocculans TaxID=1499966 RepID=A0A081BTL2_9BACT|nr:peptidase M28 [Candidatus Moduliflexus flocculans]
MRLFDSTQVLAGSQDQQTLAMLADVREDRLREIVATLAVPRHFSAHFEQNQWTEAWLCQQLEAAHYAVEVQGKHCNIVARSPEALAGRMMVIGAHYDSVIDSPGADDNASAVAAVLVCAEILARYVSNAPICVVLFNREEEFIIGSADFVREFLPISGMSVDVAHVLEMVGYCSHAPHSQRKPRLLPLALPSVGNFLGLAANRHAASVIAPLLRLARTYLPDFPVCGVELGGLRDVGAYQLLRSDHVHFWRKQIPALMWTDTAFFRNPHYHRPTDTPNTLDYAFLRSVTQLLLLQAFAFGEIL